MANIANTFFQAGPKDDLAVVDVYSTTNTKVKTSLLDRTLNSAGNVVNSILSNPEITMTVASALMSGKNGLQLDQNQLLSSLNSSSLGNRSGSLLSGFGSNINNSLLSNYNNISNIPGSSSVLSSMGSYVDKIDPSHLASSNAITSYLGNLTNNFNLSSTIGTLGERTYLQTFMTEAIKIGSPGAFEMMLSSYDGRPEYGQMTRGVLSGCVSQCCQSGNTGVLQTIVNKIGGPTVMSELPSVITNVLSNYRLPSGTSSGGYRDELSGLTGLLGSITPNWNSYNRQYQTTNNDNYINYNNYNVSKLDSFSYASDDALSLLRLDSNYKTESMIAKSYPSVSLFDSIKSKYPLLKI